MKKRSELLFSVLQIPLDYLMLVVGFVLAFLLREGSGKPFSIPASGYSYLKIMLIVLPVWLLIFAVLGLYRLRANRTQWLDLGRIMAGCAAGIMLLIVIDFLSTTSIFPAKSIPIYGFIFAALFVSFGRLVMALIQRICAHYGVGVYQVLFIGSGAPAVELRSALKSLKSRYNIVQSLPSLGSVQSDTLKSILNSKHIDGVIVADTSNKEEKLQIVLQFCQQNHLVYQFAPTIAGLYSSKISASEIRDIPVLELQPTPLEGWGRILKRIFDVVLTTIIVVISLPFQVVIALLIKITDPGPVIYKHARLGRNNQEIAVYKFRTMKKAYCTGGEFGYKTTLEALESFNDPALVEEFKETQKVKNDPRISKIGKFLRKTSLDELPQLYNILKSELSLVGPRPVIESELERYGKESNLFMHIKPGLTGLWQVSGRNDINYESRVKLDIYYIENWSIWLDINILFKTVWVVIRGKDGY